MVVQTAPATRVAIGEELGLAPGSVSTGQMVAGLKALGFDHVFDTGEGAVCHVHSCCFARKALARAGEAGETNPSGRLLGARRGWHSLFQATPWPLHPPIHKQYADFSADLTIMEEGTELLARVKANAGNPARSIAAGAAHAAPPLPMFTSCCPG